jgi:hypothetical protein
MNNKLSILNESAVKLIPRLTVSKIENYEVGTIKPMASVSINGLEISNLGRCQNGFFVEIKTG